MKFRKLMTLGACALGVSMMIIPTANAAKFSSSKLEYLQGSDYERNDDSQTILTFANASGFEYGDTYIFADYGDWRDTEATDGIHSELSGRLSLLRTFGDGAWSDGAIKDIYLVTQFDITGNRFVAKTVDMFGLSLDWNVPGFRFVKTHLQLRDDPTLDGDSFQFNLVWNKGFSIGNENFSFEGFLDWTDDEGSAVANLLTQPVLIWHATKSVGVGLEYQYWQNRLGIDGRDEKAPQLLLRWKF